MANTKVEGTVEGIGRVLVPEMGRKIARLSRNLRPGESYPEIIVYPTDGRSNPGDSNPGDLESWLQGCWGISVSVDMINFLE